MIDVKDRIGEVRDYGVMGYHLVVGPPTSSPRLVGRDVVAHLAIRLEDGAAYLLYEWADWDTHAAGPRLVCKAGEP